MKKKNSENLLLFNKAHIFSILKHLQLLPWQQHVHSVKMVTALLGN